MLQTHTPKRLLLDCLNTTQYEYCKPLNATRHWLLLVQLCHTGPVLR